jgi:hypothetical protein
VTLARNLAVVATLSDYQDPEQQAAASLRLSQARREIAEATRQERFKRYKGATAVALLALCFIVALLNDPGWFGLIAAALVIPAAAFGWWLVFERGREGAPTK